LIRLARSNFATCVLTGLLLAAAPAFAHPHVWVDAKAEIVFDAKGEITNVRHSWRFDPDFSAYATVNLDANNDGKLSEEELKPLADTNMDALKDYDYFTYLYVGTKKVAFAKPTVYRLEFQDDRLTLFYTLPLNEPLALRGNAMLEIGDPEYFVAISLVSGEEVKLDGAPKGCTTTCTPPRPLDGHTMAMLGAIPASQHDIPQDLAQAATALSNVVQLHCPGRGADVSAARTPMDAATAAAATAAAIRPLADSPTAPTNH
jgi:ABC-type uncharacterized transport system substrate-binding protein